MSEELRVKSEERKARPLVVPTKEQFDEWVEKNGFTALDELLDGYAIVHAARKQVREEIEDNEGLVNGAIYTAENEIEDDIFSLFVCAFKDFAEKGGAK